MSAPGLVPRVSLTFEEAAAACAAWPPVDATGVVYGTRHLATAQEWEDAGDGQIGEGALRSRGVIRERTPSMTPDVSR